jgi:hypothetical protein
LTLLSINYGQTDSSNLPQEDVLPIEDMDANEDGDFYESRQRRAADDFATFFAGRGKKDSALESIL